MKLIFKILIPVVLLLLITFLVINYLTTEITKNVLFEEQAVSIIRNVTTATGTTLQQDDFAPNANEASLSAKMKVAVSKIDSPSIFRIKVWDSKVKIVYSDLSELINTSPTTGMELVRAMLLVHSDSKWVLQTADQAQVTEKGFGSYLDILVPINNEQGKTVFVVEVYSTTASAMALLQGSINDMVYTLVGLGFGFFVVMYILIELIVARRMKKLADAMTLVGGGHLSVEVVDNSADEIGILFKNFNNMRLQLKTYLEQVANSKKEVEEAKEVLEKTNIILIEKNGELEKFKKLTIDRELKMIEIKEEMLKCKSECNKK